MSFDVDAGHRMVATLLAVLSQFSSEVMANQERTFIMVKPDGVHRGLVGEIMKRFEQRGYKLVATKMMWVSTKHCGTAQVPRPRVTWSMTHTRGKGSLWTPIAEVKVKLLVARSLKRVVNAHRPTLATRYSVTVSPSVAFVDSTDPNV